MSTTLPITNFVTVSVATPPAGLDNYAINNLLILTKETPLISQGDFSTYLSPADVGTDWGTDSEVYAMANAIFSQSPNILTGGGQLIIASQGSGETLAQAINRLLPLVFFGGILSAGYAANDAEFLAAAAVVQPLKRLLFVPSALSSSLNSGGLFFQIQADKFTYSRCLLYTVSALLARTSMAPAYAGRAMSVDFSGSATMLTMHAKDLIGVAPDTGITQTILDLCKTIGADVYTVFGPLPKVFSTGGNTFFDQIYGETALVWALQVAGFNAIATTSTKLPQTEPGMAILRGAYLQVLQQYVGNGYIAPGAWNSPDRFGDPEALIRNVLQLGYYLYSLPVNLQLQTDREARKAPIIQIAVKLAGAIQSSNLLVFINP